MNSTFNPQDKNAKMHYIGTLDQKVIELLHIARSPRRIFLGRDKIEYIMKHKSKFEY